MGRDEGRLKNARNLGFCMFTYLEVRRISTSILEMHEVMQERSIHTYVQIDLHAVLHI